MTLKELAKNIKADIPAVFIALKDQNTPIIAKIFAGITVGYALSPIDLIPDFIPVLGYLDDIIILPVLVMVTIKLIPDEVWQRSKEKAVDIWKEGKPKKWYYAIPIVAIWALLIWLTDSNLNHTGIYLYSKGKIMIHLTFDYKTDEKCTTPGQYLKYHRTFQGLSTRELAEKVGIVPATLVLYENDRHPIKHSTAVALANALGIDRNRLLDKYTAFVDYPYSSLLKKVRQDLSLTQIQMAELIGIGQTSYSGWEREIRVPRRKEYDKILAALEKLRVNVDTYLCQSASI